MNMFNFRTVSFSLALAAMLGLAATAMAAEDRGAGMMGLSPEKQEIARKLHEDFYNSTKTTRQELISKRHELDAQLYSLTPDEKKIQALTKEISELRAKLYSARVALKGQLIKEGIPPKHGGRAYGHGRGMGRGPGNCDGKGRGGMDGCCGPR